MTTTEAEKLYLPLYVHFPFYRSLFGITFDKACKKLVERQYTLECYPGHCDVALPYILAAYTPHQKVKLHLNTDTTVDMIEVCENDDGFLHYRKLFATE